MIDGIAKKSLERTRMAPEDYTKDGIVYCGVCNRPKQRRLRVPDGGDKVVGVNCDCAEAEYTKQKADETASAFAAQMERRSLEDGLIDPSYIAATLAADDGKNEKISRVCRRYVEQWEKMLAENMGLLFYGPVGTGKTFYASCIANELIRRQVPAVITSFPRLLNLLQSSKDRQGLIDRMRFYKFLVIDDLGVERDTGYAAEQIFAVIDARCRSRLPLIVTTNLTPKDMATPPTMQYHRIFDRLEDMCPVKLLVDGESRRIQNAQHRRELARELLK